MLSWPVYLFAHSSWSCGTLLKDLEFIISILRNFCKNYIIQKYVKCPVQNWHYWVFYYLIFLRKILFFYSSAKYFYSGSLILWHVRDEDTFLWRRILFDQLIKTSAVSSNMSQAWLVSLYLLSPIFIILLQGKLSDLSCGESSQSWKQDSHIGTCYSSVPRWLPALCPVKARCPWEETWNKIGKNAVIYLNTKSGNSSCFF